MATQKESELDKVTLSASEFLRGITSAGKSVLMTLTNAAEALRSVMSTATETERGLISSSLYQTKYKTYAMDDSRLTWQNNTYIKLSKFGNVSNGESTFSHIMFGSQEVVLSGIIQHRASGGIPSLLHNVSGVNSNRASLILAEVSGEKYVCIKNVSGTDIYGVRLFLYLGDKISSVKLEIINSVDSEIAIYKLG